MVSINRLASKINLRQFINLSIMVLTLVITMFSSALTVNADLSSMKTSLQTAGAPLKPAGSSGDYIPNIVANLINTVLSIIGILLLVYMIYAGFLWMTAGGEGKQVEQAKTMIKNSIIGILIIGASFVIADFILSAIISAFGGGTVGGG